MEYGKRKRIDPLMTELHYATMKKDVDRMRWLITHGANSNARDSHGNTPLHWAVTRHLHAEVEDRPDIVEMLINGGASVDARNSFQFTPFLLAVRDRFCQSAEKLIARGAAIEARRSSSSWGALYLAVKAQNLRMIKMLISHKINMNVQYAVMKETPLHEACRKGFKDVVALLIKFGADMSVPNRNGKTALQLLKPDRPSSEAIVKIIIREAVRRELLDQHICKKYRKIAQSCEKYSKLDRKCREEIKRMQSQIIDVEDSAVSFFDIFSMNEEKLTALARNKNIITAFETSAYLSLFEMYAVDLYTKIQEAKRRANFRTGVEDCLADVVGAMSAAPILQKIAAYVEDDDTMEY